MSNLWMALEFVFCLNDTILLYIFCSRTLGKKPNLNQNHYLIGSLLETAMTFTITCISIFSVWKTIMSIILILLYIALLFGESIKKKILCFSIFFFVYLAAEAITVIFLTIVGNFVSWEIFSAPGSQRIVLYCISRVIIVLAGTIIIYLGYKKDTINIPFRHWIIYLSASSIITIFMIMALHIGFTINYNSGLNTLYMILTLSFLVAYFCIYFLFIKMNIYYQKVSENNMLEYQNELIEKYILQKQDSDKIIKILSHDLKHNLLLWKRLAESKGYTDVLNEISEYEQTYEAYWIVDVFNDVANAIINQKVLAAREWKINFNIKGVFFEGLTISSIDLCSLLGNLLDNATEACAKVKDISKRAISFYIKRDGNFLFLEVVNSYEVEPVLKDNRFITKKQNRLAHGIGMLSINAVVEKYDGAIENTFQDDEFRTVIMLRAYE